MRKYVLQHQAIQTDNDPNPTDNSIIKWLKDNKVLYIGRSEEVCGASRPTNQFYQFCQEELVKSPANYCVKLVERNQNV